MSTLEPNKTVDLQVQPKAEPDEPHTAFEPVKCPKCGAELVEVKVYCKEENSYNVSLGEESYGKQYLDWDLEDTSEGTCESSEVVCPKCKETLFTIKGDASNSEELKEFLRSGEVPLSPMAKAVGTMQGYGVAGEEG
jgi:ribosomal protein S27E